MIKICLSPLITVGESTGESQPSQPRMMYGVTVPAKGSGRDVVMGLKALTGLEDDELVLSEVYNSSVYKTYYEKAGGSTANESIRSIRDNDTIVAFQVLPPKSRGEEYKKLEFEDGKEEEHLGKRVQVFWQKDRRYYNGVVKKW